MIATTKENDTSSSSDIKKPEGASLLYVVTFCSSLFGSEAGLSFCRSQMLSKVHYQSGSCYLSKDLYGGAGLRAVIHFVMLCYHQGNYITPLITTDLQWYELVLIAFK